MIYRLHHPYLSRTDRFPGPSGSGRSAMWIEYQKGKSVAQLVGLLPHSHSQLEGPGFDTRWGRCVCWGGLLSFMQGRINPLRAPGLVHCFGPP